MQYTIVLLPGWSSNSVGLKSYQHFLFDLTVKFRRNKRQKKNPELYKALGIPPLTFVNKIWETTKMIKR